MDSTPYIDPRELPFTKGEIFEALRLWVSDAEALEMANQFAEMAHLDMRDRAEDGQHMKVTGADDESDDTNFQWLSPEQLLPTLSVLSDDCAARVHAFMAPYWQRRLERRIKREAINAAERICTPRGVGRRVPDGHHRLPGPSRVEGSLVGTHGALQCACKASGSIP
jgi:hypothetical protein